MTDRERPYEAALVEPKTVQERVLDVAANLANFVPVLGGSISSVLSGESSERRWKRVEEFLLGLYDDLSKVKSKVRDANGSEEFEALLEETLRKVANEPRAEKRELYRRFLKRILEPSTYPDERRILRLIDELSSDHIRILRAMAQPPSTTDLSISSVEQTLATRTGGDIKRDRVFEVVEDLNSMRLAQNSNRMGVTMTGSGAQNLRGDLTPFGRIFLDYIG